MTSLTIIGDIGVDFVLGPLADYPVRGTEMIVERSEMRPGFSAANAALAARHLGADCMLIGDVGDDPIGHWLVAELDVIETRIGHVSAATTMTVAVLHDDGERSFLTTRGHLEAVAWPSLDARLPVAEAGAIALMTGLYLQPQLAADYATVLASVRAKNYRVAVDTGWPPQGWTGETCADAERWLTHCDILLLNEVEVTGLSKCVNVDKALGWLAARLAPGGIAVAKTGSKGASACDGTTMADGNAPQAQVFDTVGAGDSFNAGFLLTLLGGAALADALTAGCRAATEIIAHFPRATIAPGALKSLVA